MSSTFTPSNLIDVSKEKEWAANIGMLDWDSTSIVFSKRSLIEFLKYAGITVDTNFNNISKLPRFAKFGKLAGTSAPQDTVPVDHHQASGIVDSGSGSGVQAVSGSQMHNIFGHDEGDDALSMAPPKPVDLHQESSAGHAVIPQTDEAGLEEAALPTNFKPTRRVRTQPGGHSNLSNFWGTDEPVEEYKPSRRVRERPGGQDHINNIL